MNATIIVNPDDSNFWDNEYTIELNHVPTHIVYAESLQDAIDYLIDYWEEHESENPGYFLSDEELAEEEYPDELISGGNHGRYTSFGWHEIHIKKVHNSAYHI